MVADSEPMRPGPSNDTETGTEQDTETALSVTEQSEQGLNAPGASVPCVIGGDALYPEPAPPSGPTELSIAAACRLSAAEVMTLTDPGGLIAEEPPLPWMIPFLRALILTGSVSSACLNAGISRAYIYRVRDSNKGFAARWSHAQAARGDVYERVAGALATGFWRKRWHGGRVVGYDWTVSEGVLLRLLAAEKPEKYGERVAHEHSGPGGAPIQHAYQEAIDKVYGSQVIDVEVIAPDAPPALPPPPDPAPGAERGA